MWTSGLKLAAATIAIALLSLVLATACNGGGEEPPTATPAPSPSATATPTAATSVPTVGPVLLEEGAHITQEGTYLAEVATGKLWRLDGGRVWSPDGTALLSWGCCIGEGSLDLINVPDGPAVRLVNGDMTGAAWSADGSQIYFSPAKAKSSLAPGLYAINRDGSGLKRLSDTLTWVGQLSPRGDRMAFQGRELRLLEMTTGHVSQIADGTDWPWSSSSLAWSPDGNLLAFTNDSGLYLYEPDSGERRQLAVGQSNGPILWSPDGSRIAFRFGPRTTMTHGAYAYDPQVGPQLPHVVDVQGSGEPKPLPVGRGLSWSPDGTRIAYLNEGCITGNWDIFTVQPDGSSATPLTDPPNSPKEGPEWSPVGSNIAFSTLEKLMLVNADSGQLRTLAVSDAIATISALLHLHGSNWSPDGRYIVFFVGGAHGICD